MDKPQFTIEEIDAEARAPYRDQSERFRRNRDWLQTHWTHLLPQARGKFVAVAGQESFLADTPDEAWAWVAHAHPEDDGAFVRYVRVEQGPRIYYANRG